MTHQIQSSELIKKLLLSTIAVIGRRTTDGYAAVMINNALKSLEDNYQFFRFIKITNPQFYEIPKFIEISPHVNKIDQKEIIQSLQILYEKLLADMGKNSSYFFIKELIEHLDPDINEQLNTLGLNLNYLQMKFLVEKKTFQTFDFDSKEWLKELITTILDTMEKHQNRHDAIKMMTTILQQLQLKYKLLHYIKVIDVRYISGANEVNIETDILKNDPQELSAALSEFLHTLSVELEQNDYLFFIRDLHTQLKPYVSRKLETLNIQLIQKEYTHDMIFKQAITTIITILAESSSINYAIYAMKTMIQKNQPRYDFLKYVSITQDDTPDKTPIIHVQNTINTISDIQVRMAFQRLFEEVITILGEDLGRDFISQFQDTIEKKYLKRMEELGVNFHMINLRNLFLHKP